MITILAVTTERAHRIYTYLLTGLVPVWVNGIHEFTLVDVLTLGTIGRWLKSGWTFYGLWDNNGRAVSAIQGTTLVVFEQVISLRAVANVGTYCVLALVLTVTGGFSPGLRVVIYQFALVDVLTLATIRGEIKTRLAQYSICGKTNGIAGFNSAHHCRTTLIGTV